MSDPLELQFGFGFAESAPAPESLDAEEAAWEAEETARAADTFLAKLQSLGLQHVRRLVLTRNRSVLITIKGFDLRVHEGYASAPTEIHLQIVRFVMARRDWERQAAREAIVAHPLPRHTTPPRAPERTHPEDESIAEQLAEWHTRFNGERFDARLRVVPIRVSRRMVRRLGHYAPGVEGGGAEIAISARHLRRDGLASALETLLHEMVHQWQHETGLPIDHGAEFRRKCREVGAVPSAKRAVC
ncbi:MAG: SprT-like domain-containing protein [Gemmatimonadota bacterium]|nr:SprT-like domain-containing protein [Gemmatimonadota bacterium]MDQ8156902.1 SprT-like domain-containing protein [Gemmatimonadota bacterium]MDQ8177398.1 SprT-like domain-containing protein [Gemmatimonadota bacterium]